MQFLIGGFYRYKELKRIGYGMRTYANFSRLQKTKMLLYLFLIIVEALLIGLILVYGLGEKGVVNFR